MYVCLKADGDVPRDDGCKRMDVHRGTDKRPYEI